MSNNEEMYEKFIKDGESGLYEYFNEIILNDIGNEDEAEEKADEQTDDYLQNNVLKDKNIANQIADIIIEKEIVTKTPDEWNAAVDKKEEFSTLLFGVGKTIQINPKYYDAPSSGSSRPVIIREKVSEHLKEKYLVLSDVEAGIPGAFKINIIKKVIILMNEKSGGPKLRRVGEINTSGSDPTAIKETLANFTINDKQLRTPRQIPPGIKPNNIKTAKMLDNEELKAIKAELEEYAEMYGNRPHISPLLDKIDMLLENSKTYLVDIDADTLIGQLDLKYLSRRKAIYQFWANRYNLQTESPVGSGDSPFAGSLTIQQASDKFLKSLLGFKQGGKTELPPELDALIDEFKTIHTKMKTDNSFTYIVAFNPSDDELRSKMKLNKLQKVDDNALNVMYSFLEETYPDLLEDQEEYETLTELEHDESFSRTG